MKTIYLIIGERGSQTFCIETEYSTDLEDYACDAIQDGFDVETYAKEEDDIHFRAFNL